MIGKNIIILTKLVEPQNQTNICSARLCVIYNMHLPIL